MYGIRRIERLLSRVADWRTATPNPASQTRKKRPASTETGRWNSVVDSEDYFVSDVDISEDIFVNVRVTVRVPRGPDCSAVDCTRWWGAA